MKVWKDSFRKFVLDICHKVLTIISMEINRKRITYLDIMRIVACVLVVMVHVSAQHLEDITISAGSFMVHSAYNTLAFSGVALYLMISGALILDPSKRYSIKDCVIKSIHTFGLYFFWKLIFMIFDAIQYHQTMDGAFFKETFINLIKGRGYYHLWFLPAIAIIYLFVPLIKKSVEDSMKTCIYYVVIFFILAIMAPTLFNFDFKFKYTIMDFFNNNDFSLFTGYLGFFVLGHLLHRYGDRLSRKMITIIYILGIISLPVAALLDYSLSSESIRSMAMNTPFSVPSFIMTTAIFLLIKNIKWNDRKHNHASTLAGLTLGIYLIHPMIIIASSALGLTSASFVAVLSIPVISLLITVVSGIIIFLLTRIPVIKRLFMF